MDTPNCSTTCAGIDAENLNRDCRCISVDRQRLQATLAGDPQGASLLELISATRPHLFAQLPVFVGRTHIAQMQSVVRAIETVVETPAYREHVLAHASDIARYDPGPRGVFLGYDFHLGINGPQLIEINTNAGGALLNVALADAQRACCAEVEPLLIAPGTYERIHVRRFSPCFSTNGEGNAAMQHYGASPSSMMSRHPSICGRSSFCSDNCSRAPVTRR